MSIERVAIVGTGTQGAQIAYRCAVRGYDVRAFDASAAARDAARKKIRGWLGKHVAEGRLAPQEAAEAEGRLQLLASLSDTVADADLVIEAVPENLELKRAVWLQIDGVAPAETLLATNSSSIPSSRLAEATNRQGRTFSLNFDFPVEDSLVELMWNGETSQASKEVVRPFLVSLGMIVLESHREIQGFSFNRVWRAIKKECLHLVGEGYSDVQGLDRHFMLTFGTSLGPFAFMDMVGLDVVRDIELSYCRESGDPADLPPTMLLEMIERGELGVKTGKGFYEYPNPAYQTPGWLEEEHTAG